MDETTDCTTVEQVVTVLRTVSGDLEVSEHFVGLYNTKDATADTLTGLRQYVGRNQQRVDQPEELSGRKL